MNFIWSQLDYSKKDKNVNPIIYKIKWNKKLILYRNKLGIFI